jgi:hypothetical protein
MRIGLLIEPRVVYLFAAVVVGQCGFIVALSLATTARADQLEIDVSVSLTSMTVQYAGSTLPTSGGTVPQGCYVVVVDDNIPEGFTQPNFEMTGLDVPDPDLASTDMGPDAVSNFGPEALVSGTTYTVANTTYSGQSVSFSASGNGSTSCASSSSSPTTASTPITTPNTTPTTPATTPTVTITPPKLKGTLSGTVSAVGRATLTLGGKSVKTLKTGLYKIVVDDHSTKAGLFLGEGSKTKVTLSGIAETGKTTHSVTFTSGTWWVETTNHRPKTAFTVT